MIGVARDGRVARLTLDRGDGRNPLSLALLRRLRAELLALDEDESLSAVILAAAGGNFSVGFDLKDPDVAAMGTAGAGARRRAAKVGPQACAALEALEPVTIAAVDGHCVGGGVALAVACDFIVAGRDARFLIPEIDRGMNMSWGALPRLVNLVGPAWTKRLCIAAETITAEQAAEIGLVTWLVESGTAQTAAAEIAARIAAKPPVAVRMIKRGVNAYANALARAASDMDGDQFALATFTDDFAEGVASFVGRRPPRFTGE